MAVDIWQEMAKESDENNSYLLQKEKKSTRTKKWPFGSSSKVLCTPIVLFGTLASAIRPLYKHLYHLFLGDMYDDSMVHVTWKFSYMNRNLPYLNPIQASGALCASSPKSQHIFKTARPSELLLWDFSYYVLSIKKSSVPPTSPHICFQADPATFWLTFETQIANVYQVFPPERNFQWENLLCFRHHNALRSLIIANIRTVTMETFQQIILPKINMVVDTKTTD